MELIDGSNFLFVVRKQDFNNSTLSKKPSALSLPPQKNNYGKYIRYQPGNDSQPGRQPL